MSFDIIGDIHGHADKLESLLKKLGYSDSGGAFRRTSRQVIFVGDFIDRGPRQVDTVNLVRRMVDSGSAMAVMGNHELNAIAWQQADPDFAGKFLRPRNGEAGEKNRRQHAAFLAEVEHRPALNAEIIEWFLTLPLWLELPGLRVVHACWNDESMGGMRPLLRANLCLDRELMVAATRPDRQEFGWVETITKGLEIALPGEHQFVDKDGHVRRNTRIRWWDRQARSYRDLAHMPDDLRHQLPDATPTEGVPTGYHADKPVFFGHYWLTGQPRLQSSNTACVDYSAGRGGPLMAYRWDGEAELLESSFIASDESTRKQTDGT